MKNSSESNELEVVLENIFEDDSTLILDKSGKLMEKSSIDFDISISHDQTMPYLVQISDRCIDDNREFFQSYFMEFIDSDGRIGVSMLISDEKISIDDFVKNHIMNAVLYLKPKKVSRILTEWKNKNSVKLKIGFILDGVKINNKIKVDNLIIEPSSLTEIPEMREVSKCYFTDEIIPFYRSNDIEKYDIMYEYGNIIPTFSNCLTIICNNYIPVQKYWIESELIFFNPSLKPISYQFENVQQHIDLTRKDVAKAHKLVPKFSKMFKNVNYKTGFQRLMKSMRATNDFDKAIELRIALDALFTRVQDRNPGVITRSNAAMYLEKDSKKRIEIKKIIGVLQSDASTIIHGGRLQTKSTPKKTRKPGNIKEVQEICCRALVKMAEEETIPNWEHFILM